MKHCNNIIKNVAADICGQLDCVQEFWNDCEILTDERIKAIKKDLQEIAED